MCVPDYQNTAPCTVTILLDSYSSVLSLTVSCTWEKNKVSVFILNIGTLLTLYQTCPKIDI